MGKYEYYEKLTEDNNQDQISIAWYNYVNSRYATADSCLRKEVSDGWKRSKYMSVPPNKKSVYSVISEYELKKKQSENAVLLDISKSLLKNITTFVSDSNFVTSIADTSGIILDVFGDPTIKSAVQEGNWIPGADWSETSIGYNVIGSCLYLKEPIMIFGHEHYCRCCHNYSGASAPIWDGQKLLGVVSIVGENSKLHPHTLGMMIGTAQAIGMQLQINHALINEQLHNEYQKALLDSIDTGILGIDASGNVIFYNNKAETLIGTKNSSLNGLNIFSLLTSNSISWLKSPYSQNDEQELLFNVNNKIVKCICSFRNVQQGNNYAGIVMALKDFDSLKISSKKFVQLKPQWTLNTIIGENSAFKQNLKMAGVAAESDCNVFILGESGTGKEVLAQAIHNASNRKSQKFVAINCGAIPKDLIASELFGYSDGAFTGAKKGGHKGKFELANNGTLFLDEIGEMPMEQQSSLLRILEDSSFYPIGSSVPVPINVRIIAATNKDILEQIEQKNFREDLYYRLNVFNIETIPLRYRKDDIEKLSNSFLQKIALKSSKKFVPISPATINVLAKHNWPGNIRELQNCLERAFLFSPDGIILPSMLNLGKPSYSDNKDIFLEDQKLFNNSDALSSDISEEERILEILRRAHWNISKASNELHMSRPTLYRIIKKYNIIIPR